MGTLLQGIIAVLLLAVLALVWKVVSLRKSAREIEIAFRDRLATDTNTLIDLSSRDRRMRSLAAAINAQLRLLREERRRYQQGDRELKDAITGISHDLRTPLTAIRGYLELLLRDEHDAQTARYLAQIENRTQALTDLTEELFRYSVVATSQPLQPARVDLVRLVEENLLAFHAAMRSRGITPTLCLPDAPVWRELDEAAVSRTLSNIISNALKYSGGDLAVSMTPDGEIVFTNHAPTLDALDVGRLFDRYYTVESGRDSSGLGLSIAKTLTERMGGTIRADVCAGVLRIRLAFPSSAKNE